MARIAIMALEGIEEEVVEQTAGVEQIADQPENDMVEMQVAQTQIQGVDDAMDEAAETGETLTQVHDQMAQTVADGGQGMEPAAAQAVQVAVEHMCKRLGFPAYNRKFSMEGFSNKSTRVKATMEAMDDIKGWLKRIWEAIVSACKSAIDWVVKFYDKLFDGAAKLQKRAKEVAATADAKIKAGDVIEPGSTVTKGLMNQLNFKKYLCKNGKFMTGAEILAACKELTAMTDLEKNAFMLLSSVGPVEAGKTEASKLMSHVETYLNSMGLKGASGNTKIKAPERMSLYEGALPFGDMSIFAFNISNISGEEAKSDIGKIKMFIDSNSDKEVTGDLETTPFLLKDIVSSAKAIDEHMGRYVGIRAQQATLKKEQEKIQTEAEKASKGAAEGEKNKVMIAAAFTRAQISLTTSALSAIRSYDISACKTVLDYASKSLGAYGAAKK